MAKTRYDKVDSTITTLNKLCTINADVRELQRTLRQTLKIKKYAIINTNFMTKDASTSCYDNLGREKGQSIVLKE